MRLSLMMATVVAGVALAGAANAQDPHAGHEAAPAQDGQYSASLTRMITATADGECPADLMAADLLAACNERVETYEVFFESGPMLTWGIGGYTDGKFTVAFVSG